VHKRLDGPGCGGPSSELLATASLGVRTVERNLQRQPSALSKACVQNEGTLSFFTK
jgi:hypothetical protein